MKKIYAFTLVELIVAITVVIILTAVGYVSFSTYVSQSRDAQRLSDTDSITLWLNLFHAHKDIYPSPSDGVDITLDGAVVWTQWVFWTGSMNELWKVFWDLRDPLHKNYYSYSVTQSRGEYQLAYILEKSSDFWDGVRWGTSVSYMPDVLLGEAYAYSEYDVSELNPVVWLDGRDIDGDGDETDNPVDGDPITTWTNKWSRWASSNPTVTHGTITYEDNAVYIYQAPLIGKQDGMRFENSSISQGEIYYVLHDSGWKASWYALQGTEKKYTIGSYKNYRNSLQINNSPSHINTAPAIKNTNKRKGFFYSFLTDGTNYEFRNSGNLISQGATNSISDVTWAINKAWWYNRTNELADWAIWELIIFDTELSDDERFEVEGYLAHKWLMDGYLPTNHPYKDDPPGWWEEDEEIPLPEIQEFPNAPVFVKWNYNKLFTHGVTSASDHIVLASPSITASDLSSTDFLDIIADKKLVYEGYGNIPAAYTWDEFTSTWGLDFVIGQPIAFSGSRSDLASYRGIKDIDGIIRTSYEYSPFYKDIAWNFTDYTTEYIVDILSDHIGVNPIKPYYCSEILERKFIYNIARNAVIDASPVNSNSGTSWVQAIANGIVSTEGNLNTEYQTDTLWGYIELRLDAEYPVWFVRIYNSVGLEASYLSQATIELYKSWEVEPRYSHTLWDTSSDRVIDLDLEWIWELHEVDIVRLEGASGSKLSLREMEVYIGGDINSGFYTVDSDGIWGKKPYKVYCDMVTDGGGWTQVGTNYVDRSSFESLVDPSSFTGYQSSGNVNEIWKNTLRSDITSPSDLPNANVLRHTDNSSGYYELFFEDIPNIEFTTEIRLWAWVKWTQKSPFSYIIQYADTAPIEVLTEEDISVDPNVWRFESIRIPIEDVLENFSWHIGKWINATSTPLDITGVSLELFYK